MQFLEAAVAASPKSALMHRELGLSLKQCGRHEEAIAAYSKAIELDPEYVLARRQRANVYITLRQYDKAVADLTDIIDLDPNDVQRWLDRGFFYIERFPKYDKAIADLTKALELDSKSAWALSLRARAYTELHQYAKALADTKKAIEMVPKHAPSWNIQGYTYMRMGRHDKAIEDLTKATELSPNFWWTWDLRGLTYNALGRYNEALKDLNKAVELHSNQWSRIDRGRIYRNLHQYDKAFVDYAKAIELGWRDANECNDFAWFLATCADPMRRDGNKAVALAEKAVEWAPKWEYLNTLGAAYCCAGMGEKAVKALERSMKLRNGGNSNDWFFLAMAYWQVGDETRAREWYGKAVLWMNRHAPGNAELRRFRDQAGRLLGVTGK